MAGLQNGFLSQGSSSLKTPGVINIRREHNAFHTSGSSFFVRTFVSKKKVASRRDDPTAFTSSSTGKSNFGDTPRKVSLPMGMRFGGGLGQGDGNRFEARGLLSAM